MGLRGSGMLQTTYLKIQQEAALAAVFIFFSFS